jgi:hypothetical protein
MWKYIYGITTETTETTNSVKPSRSAPSPPSTQKKAPSRPTKSNPKIVEIEIDIEIAGFLPNRPKNCPKQAFNDLVDKNAKLMAELDALKSQLPQAVSPPPPSPQPQVHAVPQPQPQAHAVPPPPPPPPSPQPLTTVHFHMNIVGNFLGQIKAGGVILRSHEPEQSQSRDNDTGFMEKALIKIRSGVDGDGYDSDSDSDSWSD